MSAMRRFPESPGTILRSGDVGCRQFRAMISKLICISFLSAGLVTTDAHAATSEVVEFVGDSADKLQRELLRHAGTRRTVRLAKSQTLIRCSACHRITIRNVNIDSAACAIAIWGGDCGYEFARDDLLARCAFRISHRKCHNSSGVEIRTRPQWLCRQCSSCDDEPRLSSAA